MRLLAALICLMPAAALADTLEATSHITAVTLYPWGATVHRSVAFTAPAGTHELTITGLPLNTSADTLRASSTGVQLGAITLRTGKLPPKPDQTGPALDAAKAEVDRLEAVLRARDAAIAEVRLATDASKERIGFLHNLGARTLPNATVEDLRNLARMIGDETLAARKDAFDADQKAAALSLERAKDAAALDKARRTLAALKTGAPDSALLTLAVEAAAPGPATVEISTETDQASWLPTYDLRLTTGDKPALALDRGATITQTTGEDWTGIDLTLSTARPSQNVEALPPYPDLRSIAEKTAPAAPRGVMMESPAVVAAAPARAKAADAAAPVVPKMAPSEVQGAVVTFPYPTPITIRNGVENLRLSLDSLSLSPKLVAEAVPERDPTAYLMAEGDNTTGQILLPGSTALFVDGTFSGQSDLDLIPAGGKYALGFGQIDALHITRTQPDLSSGDRGLFSKSNAQTEATVITVQNLGTTPQQLRILEALPYSEQDALAIKTTLKPAATRSDVDGQRGVTAWEFPLAAKATSEIRIDSTLTWPADYELQ